MHKLNDRRSLILAQNYPDAQIESIKTIARASGTDVCVLLFNSSTLSARLHEQPFSKLNQDIIFQYGSALLKKETILREPGEEIPGQNGLGMGLSSA